MNIPQNWTFKSEEVAAGFDVHVREQLPWYDLATQAVAHLGRHYLPKGGRMYDIGASTGNIGNALRSEIEARGVDFTAVEESAEMAALYSGPGTIITADALTYDFKCFDFATVFLTMMFFPIAKRKAFLTHLYTLLRPGGAIVVVDKVTTPSGYVGTALRRLTMAWKYENGTSAEDILRKELSLAGYQRPVEPRLFRERGEIFFALGEFRGWVLEKREEE